MSGCLSVRAALVPSAREPTCRYASIIVIGPARSVACFVIDATWRWDVAAMISTFCWRLLLICGPGAGVEVAPAIVPRSEPPTARIGDPLIEAVLAGLPDPVVALDHRGDVVALNARARAVAPALRPGEPVSLGLRVPEVLDAIRRART